MTLLVHVMLNYSKPSLKRCFASWKRTTQRLLQPCCFNIVTPSEHVILTTQSEKNHNSSLKKI